MNTNKPKVPQFTIPAWLAPHVTEVRAWPVVSTVATVCKVAACDRSSFSHGVCQRHYHLFRTPARVAGVSVGRWLQSHSVEVVGARALSGPEPVCWVAACARTATTHGLCKTHHQQARRRFSQSAGVVLPSDSVPDSTSALEGGN